MNYKLSNIKRKINMYITFFKKYMLGNESITDNIKVYSYLLLFLYSNFNHKGNITHLHYLYLQEKAFIENLVILFSKVSLFKKSYLSLTICLYIILNHYQKIYRNGGKLWQR